MSSFTSLKTDFNSPWRKTVELNPAAAWLCSAVVLSLTPVGAVLGRDGLWAVSVGCYLMGIWWLLRAYAHGKTKLELIGFGLDIWKTSKLNKKVAPDSVWLGKGFEWDVEAMQRFYDLYKLGPDNLRPGRLATAIMTTIYRRNLPDPNAKGSPWIHGVGAGRESDVKVHDQQWEGNTSVTGTTGAGKSQLLSLLVQQNCLKGQSAIIIDPKDDRDLESTVARVCELTGRPFYKFSLTDPLNSVRINPIGCYFAITDIASRLGSLVPSSSESDPFKAHSWLTLNTLAAASVFCYEKPTIVSLRRLIELGFDGMVIKVLLTHLRLKLRGAQDVESRIEPCETDKSRIMLLKEIYAGLPLRDKHEVCDSIISLHNNPEQWHHKMIAGLKPILTMLSAGEVGELLSPDPDGDDERPIVDSDAIIREGGVLYIAVNSLTDKVVSSAIGSIFLADFTAGAGRSYAKSVRDEDGKRLVNLYVDEASEIVEAGQAGAMGLIQLLNKGRGAGYRLVVLSQTLHDWAVGLGSMEAAYRCLGNTNNKIALRVTDPDTQEFFAKLMGEAPRHTGRYGINNGSSGNDGDVTNYSAGVSEMLTETEGYLFPPDKLGRLPDLEYLGIFSGGKIIKGRFPVVLPDALPKVA